MKKLIAMSVIALTAVVGSAHANEDTRTARISDIVRILEDNPEYIETARAALKVMPLKTNGALTKSVGYKLSDGIVKVQQPLKPDTGKIKTLGYFDDQGNWIPSSQADVELLMKYDHGTLCNNTATQNGAKAVANKIYLETKNDTFMKDLDAWLKNNCNNNR